MLGLIKSLVMVYVDDLITNTFYQLISLWRQYMVFIHMKKNRIDDRDVSFVIFRLSVYSS
jgi:hypothetical protein